MKILCTICARGGSKGLTNKALRNINKKPLIYYTVNQALQSKIFNEVVVSTKLKKIQTVSKNFGAKSWFKRPKNLSSDYSSKLLAIRHAFLESEKFFETKFEYCIDLDITSPLRKISDIKKSLNIFLRNKSLNLITVCEAKKNPYFNMVEKKNGQIQIVKKVKSSYNFSRSYSSNYNLNRRQDAPKVYEMNASIYIFRRDFLIKKKNLFNKKTSLYVMPRNRSIDIDDILDLKLVKYLIKNDK